MQAYIAVSSIFLSMILYALGSGNNTTFVPLQIVNAGYSDGAAAWIVAASAVGQMLGCLLGGTLVRRVGHIRAFAIYCVTQGVLTFVLPLFVNPVAWGAIRMAQGFCSTSAFAVSISWLNEITPSDKRGQIMTFLYVGFTLAFGSGAYVLSQLDHTTLVPYIVGGAFYCLALIPIAATRMEQPPIPEHTRADLAFMWRLSPVGFVGSLGAGAIGMTFASMGGVYGLSLGLSTTQAALLISAYSLGNVFLQWPLGYISDRVDRRLVMVYASLALVILCALLSLPYWGVAFAVTLVLFALIGGHAESIFSLASAHANDHAQPGEYVIIANSSLILWSLGATLGPLAATGAMQVTGGPWGFSALIGLIALTLMALVVYRMVRRDAPPDAEQEDFVAYPQHYQGAMAHTEAYVRDHVSEDTQ